MRNSKENPIKLKILSEYFEDDYEKSFSKWSQEHPDIDILDIKMGPRGQNRSHYLYVFYRDVNDDAENKPKKI